MKPYVPDTLPLEGLDIDRLIRKVGPANASIARYDGLLQSVVNPSVMLSPLTQREAVLSSKIEGTEVTHSQYSPAILDAIFDRAIFSSSDFMIRSEIPNATAKSALKKMREAGVLSVLRPASGSRAAVLAFAELLNFAEGRKIL